MRNVKVQLTLRRLVDALRLLLSMAPRRLVDALQRL
jgi:hypothetical protein